MRALLIVNPCATSTTQLHRDVIARALSSELDLKVVHTRYRGHARHVAEQADRDGCHLVLTLGGDGTVNEAVNGLLRARPPWAAGNGGRARDGAGTRRPPALAALPGGNANVFSRALGLPTDPVDATGQILAALVEGRHRNIGVGLAGDRYFTFNAGLGFDAEVVRAVEGSRAGGRTATAALYLWAAARQFYGVTNRREPALRLERQGSPDLEHVFAAIVSNTSPWTYLGQRPVNPSPLAEFDTGLDLFALRKLSTFRVLSAVRQMLSGDGRAPRGRHLVSLHDEPEFTLRSRRPIAFQVDGEYVGEREGITFRSVPDALRVVV